MLTESTNHTYEREGRLATVYLAVENLYLNIQEKYSKSNNK